MTRVPFKLHSIVRLNTNGPDKATIQGLTELLREAQSGDVVGIAYVALHKSKRYSMGVIGVAKTTPTFTRGMIKCLDDQVAELIVPK